MKKNIGFYLSAAGAALALVSFLSMALCCIKLLR